MTTALYIDSRWRASGSSSDFKYELSESLNLHGARMRVDAVRFTDSFYTIEATNSVLYFKGLGSNTLDTFFLPVMAYSGARLAAQIQYLTNRTCSFSDLTGDLTMANVQTSPILNDDQLREYPQSQFNPYVGATPTDPKSCNNILGPGQVSEDGSQIVFHFISMAPYQDLYLRSSALACKNVRGPAHTHTRHPLQNSTDSRHRASCYWRNIIRCVLRPSADCVFANVGFPFDRSSRTARQSTWWVFEF